MTRNEFLMLFPATKLITKEPLIETVIQSTQKKNVQTGDITVEKLWSVKGTFGGIAAPVPVEQFTGGCQIKSPMFIESIYARGWSISAAGILSPARVLYLLGVGTAQFQEPPATSGGVAYSANAFNNFSELELLFDQSTDEYTVNQQLPASPLASSMGFIANVYSVTNNFAVGDSVFLSTIMRFRS